MCQWGGGGQQDETKDWVWRTTSMFRDRPPEGEIQKIQGVGPPSSHPRDACRRFSGRKPTGHSATSKDRRSRGKRKGDAREGT